MNFASKLNETITSQEKNFIRLWKFFVHRRLKSLNVSLNRKTSCSLVGLFQQNSSSLISNTKWNWFSESFCCVWAGTTKNKLWIAIVYVNQHLKFSEILTQIEKTPIAITVSLYITVSCLPFDYSVTFYHENHAFWVFRMHQNCRIERPPT